MDAVRSWDATPPASHGPHWLAVTCTGLALTLLVAALGYPNELLWSASSCAALGLAAAAQGRRSPYGLLSPFPVAMVAQVLYVAPVALTLALGGTLNDERQVSLGAMGHATLVANGAAVCFALGYLLRISGIHGSRRTTIEASPWRRPAVVIVALLMVTVGIGAVLVLVVQVGGPGALAAATYGERYLLLQGKGYLYVGLQVASVGGILLYLAAIESHRPVTATAIVVAFGATLATWTFLVGSRSALVQFLIAIAAVRHLSVKPLRLSVVIPAGGVLLGLMVVVGLVRGRPENAVVLLATAQGSSFNLANTEFGASLTTLADIMVRVPAAAPHALGRTYLQAFAVLVPQSFWPGRPLAAGEWYAATFYPDVWRNGGAFAFSPIAEAYLNFGMAGVVILSCLAGALVGEAETRMRRPRGQGPWHTAIYALIVPWLLLLPRLDWATLLKSAMLLTLGVLVVSRGLAAAIGLASLPDARRRV